MEFPCALVIGTSGLNRDDEKIMLKVSEYRAIFRAANFSLGVHMMLKSLEVIKAKVSNRWDSQVLDFHFSGKLDTPSSTAKIIAQALSIPGQADCEIATIRMGDGVSEHTAINFIQNQKPGIYGMNDIY